MQKCHLSLGEYEINGETGVHSDLETITNASFNSKEICIAIFNNNDRVATYYIEVFQDPNDKEDDGGGDGGDDDDEIEKKKKLIWFICIVAGGVVILIIIICIIVCCVKYKVCKCCSRYEKSLLNSDFAVSINE